MTEEERRRRASLLAQQNNMPRLRVVDTPAAPALQVRTQPLQPTRVSVTATPQQPKLRITSPQPTQLTPPKVTTPYSVRNFVAGPSQPTGVAGFLARNLSPTGLKNIGKEVAQGTARMPIQFGLSIAEPYYKMATGKGLGYKPTTAVEKFAFGKEPVRGIYGQGQEITQQIEQVRGKEFSPQTGSLVGVPTAFLLGALDYATFGRGKPITRAIQNQLTKTSTKEGVQDILKTRNVNLSDEAAQQIAQNTDKKQITEIIRTDLSKQAAQTPTPQGIRVGAPQPAVQQQLDLTPTPTPRPTPTPTQNIVTELTKTKSPDTIRVYVDNILTKLPATEKTAVINQIANATDETQVRQIIDAAQKRNDAITEVAEQVTAAPVPTTQAEARAEALAEAVPTPRPAVEPQVPAQAVEVPTTAPRAVTDAVAPEQVPGAQQVAEAIPPAPEQIELPPEQVAQSLGDKLKQSGADIKDKFIEELYDPFREYQALDDSLAKTLNLSKKDFIVRGADRAYTNLAQKQFTAPQEAVDTFTVVQSTGESVANVMSKYQDRIIRKGVNYNPFIEYLQNKFFLEVLDQSNGSIWKSQRFTPEQAAESVRRFEAENPTALTDARTVKDWADGLIDQSVINKQITQESANEIKSKYSTFVPLEAFNDPEVIRPTVTGGVSSVSRLRAAQNLSEAAGNYETSWDALKNRATAVYKQTADNNIGIETFKRIKENALRAEDGFRVVIDPETAAQRRQIVLEMDRLRDILETAKKGRGKLATAKRVSKQQLATAQIEAAERARQYVIAQSIDQAGKNAAMKMSRAELLDLFDLLIETNEIKAARIAKKLESRSANYRNIALNLDETRAEIKALKEELSGNWQAAAALRQVESTNINKVAFQLNGERGVIEVSPKFAKQQEYFKSPDPYAKVANAVSSPLKFLYTGVGAPGFRLITQPIRAEFEKYTKGEAFSSFGVRPILAKIKTSLGPLKNDPIARKLIENGLALEVATKVGYRPGATAKAIASQTSFTNRLKYLSNPKNIKDLGHAINAFAAKLGNADRVQVAYGAYLRFKRLNPELPDDVLFKAAAAEGNNVLSNFMRTSKTARRAEIALLYSGATQAGVRSFFRRYRERPYQMTAKLGLLIGSVAYATAESVDAAKDFYEQKIASGDTYELDNNLIFAIPGLANYDPDKNEWSGIIKVPLPPDWKPLVKATWETVFNSKTNKEFDPGLIGKELGNLLTANLGESIYQPGKGIAGTGLLPSGPLTDLTNIGFGINPTTGQPLSTETEKATKKRQDQYNEWTSEIAKFLSEQTNGALTPYQFDALFKETGYFGRLFRNLGDTKDKSLADNILKGFTSKVYGSYGFSDRQQENKARRKNIEDIAQSGIITDEKQYNDWANLRTQRPDGEKGKFDSAQKALTLLNNPQMLAAERELNRRNSEVTGLSDPLYDDTLTDEQRQKVLTYRSMRIPNAAAQNYSKAGQSAFAALGLDEKWYEDFRTKESAFYQAVKERYKKKEKGDVIPSIQTFSGEAKPVPSPELQAKLDYYYTLPKGTGERSSFLKSNQDIVDYWNRVNDFTNEERKALGFETVPSYEEQLAQKYGTGGARRFRVGRGGGAGGAAREAEVPSAEVSTFIAGIRPNAIQLPEIVSTTPRRVKLKIQKPKATTRTTRRIRLQ